MARQIRTKGDVRLRRAAIARFDACIAKTVRCVSAIALIWCFGCIPARRGHVERDWPKTLQVAHVVSDQGFLSGFPMGENRTMTDWWSAMPFGVAVVDGFPARAAGLDPTATRVVPWCVVYGHVLLARPNQIEPRQDLHAGDAVLLGGFFAPRDGLTPVDYAELPSSVITGRLIAIPTAGVAESPLHWVLVPPGDYHSFLGGPAASDSASEGIRVWGAIAQVVPLLHGSWSTGTLLGVAKLPPKFGSGAGGS